jgi:hypothetical protein
MCTSPPYSIWDICIKRDICSRASLVYQAERERLQRSLPSQSKDKPLLFKLSFCLIIRLHD